MSFMLPHWVRLAKSTTANTTAFIADWLRLPIFTRSCVLCGRHIQPIKSLPTLPLAICQHCITQHQAFSGKAGHNLEAGFSFYASLLDYNVQTREAIVHAKYQQGIVVARRLGMQLGLHLGHMLMQARCANSPQWTYLRLLPIPLSPKRLQQRGYNQSLEIARGVAWAYQRLYPHAAASSTSRMPALLPNCLNPRQLSSLVRKSNEEGGKEDGAAALALNKVQRYTAMQSAFLYVNPLYDEVSRGTDDVDTLLLLIDDVLTSGATLNAAYRVLQQHSPYTQAGQIAAATIARTPI